MRVQQETALKAYETKEVFDYKNLVHSVKDASASKMNKGDFDMTKEDYMEGGSKVGVAYNYNLLGRQF